MDALRLACEWIADSGCPFEMELGWDGLPDCNDGNCGKKDWVDCWGAYFQAKAQEADAK